MNLYRKNQKIIGISETITFVLVRGFQWFHSQMKGLDALFKNN